MLRNYQFDYDYASKKGRVEILGEIGIATYFYLPPSPYQTASRVRGKNGWFTEREEKIMCNRILRDDPSKGGMHNRYLPG